MSDRDREKDKDVYKAIGEAERFLVDSLLPFTFDGLNGYERKKVHEHFENDTEYRVKTYREDDQIILKVYPVGSLKRLAEQKTQEVLMKGQAEELPPMGSFERFVIHDYLKERHGVRTESTGQRGEDRRIVIMPLFGRRPRKVKGRRLK
ncbi:hypothetical protein JXO52_08130 [bacterium]|nr:hypothetical protein [bacterium]